MKLSKDQIKKELLNNVIHKEYIEEVKKELDELSEYYGVDNENSLEVLYDLWKNKEGMGDENRSNSIAAWAIGLTSVKPNNIGVIDRSIYARSGFPDIDLDFDASRRGEVFEEIEKGIGSDKFSHIGTDQTVQMKTAVTYLVKAFDLAGSFNKGPKDFVADNNKLVREIIDQIPNTRGKLKGKILVEDENGDSKEKTIEVKTVDDAYKCFKNFAFYLDKFPVIRKYAPSIEGMVRGRGIHAAGIVLSPSPINTLAPSFRSNEDWGTQYVAEDLESMGFIKFDILGLAALTTITNTVNLIKERYDISIDVDNLNIKDDSVYQLYRTGQLDGVFQCEESGMQDTIINMSPDSFADIMAAIALYRPGPMDFIPSFCRRKKGIEEIDYFHPLIEKYVKKFLEKTYCYYIYQEQLMDACCSLANFSLVDGYDLIKGVGKKKKEIIDKYKEKFVNSSSYNKIPSSILGEYWERYIIPFANYGFNRAHCLTGDMLIKDKITDKFITIKEAFDLFKFTDNPKILLDSFNTNNSIEEDSLVDVFETGEKDVYEIELDNGIILKCTLEHKFYCTDNKQHTVKDILENDLEIIYFGDS